MRTALILFCWTLPTVLTPSPIPAADLEEQDPAYYHTGELAGSLRSNDPLPLFDADPQHLWNRLFAAVTIRSSLLPSVRGGPRVARIEGGDRIEFFGWGGTTYWDDSANVAQLERHLDHFLEEGGEKLSTNPLKRVLLQHDLWTLFDFLMVRQIARRGDLGTRHRRNELCRKLARAIQSLALPPETLAKLPDNFSLAIQSGRFAATHDFDPKRDQLVPTPMVQSVRLLIFKSVDGTADFSTNLGNGVNASKYTLKRRLALADGGMQHGGLHREPDDLPVYRVLFENEVARDWGSRGRYSSLTADCRSCHSGAGQTGVQMIGSVVNTASIDSGAALGVSHTLPAGASSPHPARTMKWKTAEETYRRLVEFLEK